MLEVRYGVITRAIAKLCSTCQLNIDENICNASYDGAYGVIKCNVHGVTCDQYKLAKLPLIKYSDILKEGVV